MDKKLGFFLFILVLFIGSVLFGGETESVFMEEHELSVVDGRDADVYYFYGEGCSHCANVEPFLEKMEQKYPMRLHRFDIYSDRSCLSLFDEYSSACELTLEQRGIPAVFVSDTHLVGDSEILDGFELAISEALTSSIDDASKEALEVKKSQNQNSLAEISLLAVTVAALVDAISPCSIAILIFLVGARVLVANQKSRALRVGLAFCLSVFIAYFLFGLGLFSVVQVSGVPHIFSVVVAVVTVLVGILYLKDAFWGDRGGFKLEVPNALKPLLMKLLKRVTSPYGAFVMGFVVCLFELPCTGGPYLFILGQLANTTTRLQAIPLLIYYNFIFVLPLLIISLLLFSNVFSVGRARAWTEEYARVLRFAGGIALLGLGALVVPASLILQSLSTFLTIFRTVGPHLLTITLLYLLCSHVTKRDGSRRFVVETLESGGHARLIVSAVDAPYGTVTLKEFLRARARLARSLLLLFLLLSTFLPVITFGARLTKPSTEGLSTDQTPVEATDPVIDSAPDPALIVTDAPTTLISLIDDGLASGKLVFLYFYRDGCGWCTKQKPIVDELEVQYAEDVVFLRVNTREDAESAIRFGVQGTPNMFLVYGKDEMGFVYESFRGFTELRAFEKVLTEKLGIVPTSLEVPDEQSKEVSSQNPCGACQEDQISNETVTTMAWPGAENLVDDVSEYNGAGDCIMSVQYQAGCVTIKVVYNDDCPRSNADINTIDAPNPPYVRYICTTGEDGTCTRCDYLEPGDYVIQALYSASQFGLNTYLGVNENGDGSQTITNTGSNYPDGTETCGDTGCDGYRYCVGNPKYIQCNSWDTGCDEKKCCQCDGGTETEPTENYDETQDEDCSTECIDRQWYSTYSCNAIDTCALGDPVCDVGHCDAECGDGNTNNGDGCDENCYLEVCGNGILQYGEECDDGNTQSGDGCSATCTIEYCGDSIVQPGLGEQCDDGNTNPGDGCDEECIIEECGNGKLQYGEQCDDGNQMNGDGCDDDVANGGTCVPTACGNGVLTPTTGEECDDGNNDNGDGCDSNCIVEECGNGIVQFGEECDDGNTQSGDGCSAACTIEFCGDSIVQPGLGEECDDGNTSPGDGCDSECYLEVCGNGRLQYGEECDDGDTIPGDGCDENCYLEVCGNGILQYGEECDDGNTVSGDGCSDTCQFESDYCSPTANLECGQQDTWDTTGQGSTQNIDSYSCSGLDETGREYAYSFSTSTPKTVTASLSSMAVDLDIFVLEDTGSGCYAGDCITWGDTEATFSAAADTTYYFVVDGFSGAEGAYTITVVCTEACVDNDGDGYDTCDVGAPGDDGLPIDCDDDPGACGASCYPGAAENCDDTYDNDCDGQVDYDDADCAGAPDIAITDVTSAKTVVGQGFSVCINVTAENQGGSIETFNVTALADGVVVGTATNITIAAGGSANVTFVWNTTSIAMGNYTMSANATILEGEVDVADNTLTDGWIRVSFPGDVNGDGKVRVDDVLAVALAFGSDLGDPDYEPNLDVNGDDKIRVDDILIAALNFGLG